MKPFLHCPRPAVQRALRSAAWACLALSAGACSGGSGGSGGAFATGSLRLKPEGGYYFEDSHSGGSATRLALLEITWGRLVDVHALDASGEPTSEPVLRDLVIDENLHDEPETWRLETSPITQETRLVIERVPGVLTPGREDFEALVRRATQHLAAVAPKSDGDSTSHPFSFLARNATLMLRFDDLLDDGEESVQALAQCVRLLVGYPPSVPLGVRVLFDPSHGGTSGGRFHSSRVLVDLTVSATEASDSPVPLVLNSLGLPRGDRLSPAASVSLRVPTRRDAGSGQFRVLQNLSGRPLEPSRSRPFDADSPTLELVRAMRGGNEDDTNNGFLLDLDPPRVLGSWPCVVEDARPDGPSAFDWSLDLRFGSVCLKTPEGGDIVALDEHYLEVRATAPAPDAEGRVTLAARGLNTLPPQRAELIGQASFLTRHRAGLSVDRGCWLRFNPPPAVFPNLDVSSLAETTIRFSEPVDPATALPFDALLTVRGNEDVLVSSTTLVVGRIRPSPDLRELTFSPSAPYAHESDRPLFTLRVPDAHGVTDLAGNELPEPFLPVPFSIAPDSPRVDQGSFVMRFDLPDELEPVGRTDVRGQITYQIGRGRIRPREALFASRAVDRSNPMLSLMPAFAPGVATPLSPLGSKLQAVWRYADLGWSIRDESKYNLDVIGLWWSPARGTVNSDFFEQLEIRVSHSNKLPDEQPRQPVTGGMKYPSSGLWEGPTLPFTANILEDPDSPPLVMHARALGYRIEPRDLSATSSGTPIMPWPVNRTGGPLKSFTWRDTGVLARGGNFGTGVPMDSEVGPPFGLENEAGTFAPPGFVPAVGLPLLMEFRCYPSDSAIGLNPLSIFLASNASAAPNFRAYSTGGFDNGGQRVLKNPDFEPVPTGGFNPNSRPPGNPTARTADNSLYPGQLDYVIRISRAHTIWIDTNSSATRFLDVVLEPRPEDLAPGTSIEVEFRGADRFDGAEERPFDAARLTPYGDPLEGTTIFHRDDPRWKHDVSELDGARYLQMRFSFVNNIDAGLVAELSAVGVVYALD
jgi:hypothetical protein